MDITLNEANTLMRRGMQLAIYCPYCKTYMSWHEGLGHNCQQRKDARHER